MKLMFLLAVILLRVWYSFCGTCHLPQIYIAKCQLQHYTRVPFSLLLCTHFNITPCSDTPFLKTEKRIVRSRGKRDLLRVLYEDVCAGERWKKQGSHGLGLPCDPIHKGDQLPKVHTGVQQCRWRREMMDKAKESTFKVRKTIKEIEDEAQNKSKEASSRAQARSSSDTTEKLKDSMKDGAEAMKGNAEVLIDNSKEGTSRFVEGAQFLGEKAKETAEGVWDRAKEATRKMKENVVGKGEDGRN